MANVVVAPTKIAQRLAPFIRTEGIPVDVYTLPKDEMKPCPCTNNPWKRYSSAWHVLNPHAPHCNATGELSADTGKGLEIEIVKIHAVVLPHWAYVGTAFAWIVAGKIHDWSWWCMTQDITKFNRLRIVSEFDDVYIFKVTNVMPFFIENSLIPSVTAYHLMPLEIDIGAK